jgi:hypothetical protein
VVAIVLLARGGAGPRRRVRHDIAAVMDFENAADPQDSDRLAAMLGPLLAAQLSAAGDLAVLSISACTTWRGSSGTRTGIDQALAADVARAAFARHDGAGPGDARRRSLLATAT